MSALRRRYGRAAGKTKHQLLRDAMRDWRSGQAYFKNGRYWLRPLAQVAGVTVVGHGRPSLAPWSKTAIAEWGTDTRGLHLEAEAAYPNVRGQALLNQESRQ